MRRRRGWWSDVSLPRLKGCVSELSALCENQTLFKVKESHAYKTRRMLTCMEIPVYCSFVFSLSSVELRFSSIGSWSVICSCTVLDFGCLTKRLHCIRLLLSVLERGGVWLAPTFPLSHLTIRTHSCHQELRQRERKNKALLKEVKTDEWNLEKRKKNIPNGDVNAPLCAAGGRFEAAPFFFLSFFLGFFPTAVRHNWGLCSNQRP